MAKLNTKQKAYTHEGGKASVVNAKEQLRRTVLSCLLWEDGFYEDGQTIADRIKDLCNQVPAEFVRELAVEARVKHNLRHVPLLLLSIKPHANMIANTINRADELSELLSIYWKDGRKPIPAQMKKGLAKAFTKFNEYQLAKYNRDADIKLRDVLFLTHAKPKDKEQAELWKRLVNKQLAAPDTWEVALSGGADKKETFERLLREKKLGYLALLRNLRNMVEAKVDSTLIASAILERRGAEKVLPFRFIAAARHAMQFEPMLDLAMQKTIEELPVLKGKTLVLVDVSGSMDSKLSEKSDMTMMDAAAALAVLIRSETKQVFTFSERVVEVPPRNGMGGIDAIIKSQPRGGTYLSNSLTALNKQVEYDRIIIITDEQTHDGITNKIPNSKGYIINVGTCKNGVGYGQFTHINGFSENVIKFINEIDNEINVR